MPFLCTQLKFSKANENNIYSYTYIMLFSPWKIDMEHNEDDNNLDLMLNYHYNNNIMKIIQIAKHN